jgi:RecA-family ATPase
MSPIDPNTALPLISFERVMADDAPPVAWLVDPLIADGDRVVVYGEFGAMKSWLLLDLSLHLAAGHPWLGKFPIPVAKRVLFIDEEMNERTLRRGITSCARSGA